MTEPCDRQHARAALIADDHGLYRAGLSLLLRDHFDYRSIVEAESFDAALEALSSTSGVALALFDLKMPGIGGPETLSVIRETFPNVRIAIVSAMEDRDAIMSALATGLHGYILKSSDEAEIVKAIQLIEDGGVYVPSLITRRARANSAAPAPTPTSATAPPSRPHQVTPSPARNEKLLSITPRQRDVLAGIERGLSNKEIARDLGISDSTVKIHLAALFAHFGARNRTDLLIRSRE